MLSTDVVVAGGGVAGLLIASALAPEFSVVLLEQADALPRNKYWLTDADAAEANPDLASCVDMRYDLLDFVAYDGLTATIRGDYCLWDTEKLIEALAATASVNGAKILTNHRFYTFTYERNRLAVRANSKTIHTRLFIDCMGFGSPLVGAKNVAKITGYYLLHGCEVPVINGIRPIALDNVLVNRNPSFFELFPTSRGSAHAALILPSRQHRPERSLPNEFSFIVNQSHYSSQIRRREQPVEKSYFGIVPVGRLDQPALDRIVFFGEAGQANPAASATGLTRMLKTYREVAAGLSNCLKTDSLQRRHLLRAIPPYMSRMNRVFQETLFEALLSFDSDRFRRLVDELKRYPEETVNKLLFAEFDFHGTNAARLALDSVLRKNSILGKNVLKSILRYCLRRHLF